MSYDTRIMTNRLSQLTRLMAGYSIASFIGPIFTIVLTPLYTRVLQPGDYAQLDVLTTLAGLAGSLASLGLGSAVAVYFYDGDQAERGNIITTAAAVGLAWSTLVALMLVVGAMPLAGLLLGGLQHTGLILLAALAVPLGAVGLVLQTGLRLTMQVGHANILALVNLLLTVVLNIVLVLWLRQAVWGIQTTLLLAALWTAVGGWWLLRSTAWGRVKLSLAQPLIRAGLGALPGVLALWALGYIDRLILPLYGVPAEERGLYAIAAKLSSMLAIVIIPFQVAWVPLALSMRDDPQANRTYARVLTLFAAGSLGLALGIAFFAREILYVFTTEAYLGAAPYVALLAYWPVANGITICLGIGAALHKRTEVTGISLLIGAFVNMLLNIVLIPSFGIWGAAGATLFGHALVPLLVYFWSQRIHPISYQPWRVLAILVLQVVLLLVSLNLPLEGVASIAARLGLLAVYGAGLFMLRVVTLAEVSAVFKQIRVHE
jgi:O-antigen/teichoic acid export membrane protein